MKLKKYITLISLILAVAAIIVPLMYDVIVNTRKLEARVIAQISIVTKKDMFDDLSIMYKGNKLNNLSKIQFTLLNSGKMPVSKNQVYSKPEIDLGNDVDILKVDITNKSNSAINSAVEKEGKSKIKVSFDLLNANDYIDFIVYYTGTRNKNLSVVSNIEGLRNVTVVDNSTNVGIPSKKQRNYIIEVILLLFFLSLIIQFKNWIKYKKVKKKIYTNPGFIDNLYSENKFLSYVDKSLTFMDAESRQALIDIPNETSVSLENRLKTIKEVIVYEVNKRNSIDETFINTTIILVASFFIYILWLVVF